MSSPGKRFCYEGYNMPNTNPDHDQEGAGRHICSFCFNDGSDDSLTNDEMPNMRQVVKGGPSAAECAATEVAHLKAVASGVLPVTPAPITWLTWPVEEDPMVQDYISACQEQGREPNPQHWWRTCALTDLRLWRVMAEMPANQEFCSQEEHGVYRHIKKAQEVAVKMKRGQRLESTIICDNTALEDIQKVIIAWWHNPNGVPPAVCEDPNTHKLNICDIDVTLWVKAMAPSDKKEFQRFRDLMFEVFGPTNGT
jgi:hypothetical protein